MAAQKGQASFLCQDASWSPVMKCEVNWTGLSKSTEERWKNWLWHWKIWSNTIPHSYRPMVCFKARRKNSVSQLKCKTDQMCRSYNRLTKKRQNIRREVMTAHSRAHTNPTYHAASTKEGKKKTSESYIKERRKRTENNVQRVHGICQCWKPARKSSILAYYYKKSD